MTETAMRFPVVTFAEIETLLHLAGDAAGERLPFLGPRPAPEVVTAGLASLAVRGQVSGTIDDPRWSTTAASVAEALASCTAWVEIVAEPGNRTSSVSPLI